MRAYLLILAGLPLMAQIETNIACVERLEIPTYPPLPKQARIAGTLTVGVQLGPDAAVGSISSEWTPQQASVSKSGGLFVPDVEKSLRASAYLKSCANKKVTLVFNFVLGESPLLKEITFSFGPPNQFWITAPMSLVQP
jgi:hypothetical protein